jgi:hypothetical protein
MVEVCSKLLAVIREAGDLDAKDFFITRLCGCSSIVQEFSIWFMCYVALA